MFGLVGVAYGIARLLGYNMGQAAGLLAGSHTVTSALGVAVDSIHRLTLAAAEKEAVINQVPVAYAITYIFGTAGAAWFLSSVGPKIIGVNLAAGCRKMETNKSTSEIDFLSLAERYDLRAYRVDNERFLGKSIREFEAMFGEARVFVENLRRQNQILSVTLSTVLERRDIVGVMARREMHVNGVLGIGVEAVDPMLLDVSTDVVDVVITNNHVAGKTLQELAMSK